MTTRNLDALFDPPACGSAAVDPVTAASCAGLSCTGRVSQHNPDARTQASPAPTLASLQGPVAAWPQALSELGAAGIRAVVLDAPSGALADEARARAVRAATRPLLLRMLGPGDCGIFDPRLPRALGPALTMPVTAAGIPLPLAGAAAWVSQSGAAARSALDFARAQQLGLSHLVALGDAFDVDLADVIDYLACDPKTKVVLVVLNRIRSARKWMSALRACVRNKPVLAWCEPAAGENGLAYDAALTRAGVIRVPDLPGLLDAWRELQSPRVGSSPILALYRAERERLTRTPPSLPLHRQDYADAQDWLKQLPTAARPVRLSDMQVQRLLADFEIAQGDVATQVPGALVVRLAMRDDPAIGPFLTLRAGQENAAATGVLLPLDAALAQAALDAVLGRSDTGATARSASDQLTPSGDRSGAVMDAGAAAVLVHLSELLCSVTQLLEFDARLIVDGARSCLTQVTVLAGARGTRAALAIRPYPLALEERLVWDGMPLTIRPIRPEDESAHAAFFRAMSPEDLRLRFFGVTRQPDHDHLARFVQIDYDREMALVACSEAESHEPGPGGALSTVIHGVVRAITDPDNDTTEFAVTIRSGEQGHHLGHVLMDRIIAYCRSRGTRVMVGEILRENTRMLALARDCGFTASVSEDPGVMSVQLILNPTAVQGEGA